MGKDNLKYFIQWFDSNVLNLFNQKGLYPYGSVSSFEKFKKWLATKEKFYSLLTGKTIKNNDKEYEVLLRFAIHLKLKQWKCFFCIILQQQIIVSFKYKCH